MLYKRKIISLFIALILTLIFTYGCFESINETPSRFDGDASVHFIDVGQGDCIFICLPDGKTVLIDSGPKNEDTSYKIVDFLTSANVDKINYFIITHPQADHVGNAIDIINTFEVEKVYLPDVKNFRLPLFPFFKSTVELIEQKGIKVNTNDCYDYLVGDGYGLVFLSPEPYLFSTSEYHEFHYGEIPSSQAINSISAVIYLDLFGVSFLLTGDATTVVEQNIFDRLQSLKPHHQEIGINLNLANIDFLKVSHHGSADSTSTEFLMNIQPKNAVISVDGNNFYGHPSTELLTRLYAVNPELKLFRTDVNGSVSVKINENGEFITLVDADFN